MSYFEMQGEDRFKIGDVILFTEIVDLTWWELLKSMLRQRSTDVLRRRIVERRFRVTIVQCGLAHTIRLPNVTHANVHEF